MTAYLGYIYCALATLVVIVGDYFIKTAADKSLPVTSWQFALGVFFYAASAVGWYWTMRHISLAQLGVAFSAFTILALCALGVVFFGERLYLREYLGIAAALLSVVLMARIV
jgi:small multidrug resistance pump